MASAPHGGRTPRNTRTGRTKGYSRQKGGAHQVAWQDDPIILDRIRAGLKPWLERRSPVECLDGVRAYMAEAHPGEPPIGLRTMYEDRERAQSLTAHDLQALRAEHLAELDHVIRRGWETLESTSPNSASRAALLGLISHTIERKARVDGTLATALQISSIAVVEAPKSAERAEVDMSDEAFARILAVAMDLRETHGLVIDAGNDFVSPLPPLLPEPSDKHAPGDDEGAVDYFERA